MKKFILFLSGFLLVANSLLADSLNIKTATNQWLVAGPLPVSLPAFSDQPDMKGKTFTTEKLLQSIDLSDKTKVTEGALVFNRNENKYSWRKQQLSENKTLKLEKVDSTQTELYFVATYVEAFRFSAFRLSVESVAPFEIRLNGEKLGGRNTLSDSQETKPVKVELKLETGKHLLVIKTLLTAKSMEGVDVKVHIEMDESLNTLVWSLDPIRKKNISDVLEGVRINSLQLSPDGRHYLIGYSETRPPDGKQESWYELRQTQSNKVLHNFRWAKISQIAFHPSNNSISFLSGAGDSRKLVLFDFINNKERILMEIPKDFGSYTWSPKGDQLVFSTSESDKADDSKLRKIEGMPDRWPWYRTRSQLHLFNVESGMHWPLTHGYLSTSFHDFSPDGQKILISQSEVDFAERPFSRQTVMELNLYTHAIDTLWVSNHSATASYSPEGNRLLVTGGPMLFDGIGLNVPEGTSPNNYDTQAFIYDLEKQAAKAITRDFDPKIMKAAWSSFDGRIYLQTEDKAYNRLVVYDPVRNTYRQLEAEVEIVLGFDLAKTGPALVYYGNSISAPEKAMLLNTRNLSQNLLSYPEKEIFDQVEMGNTKVWQTKVSSGQLIEGQVYYPPGFDPEKKYPMIVYYYGGTNPVDRSFRGRYPKNYFAAHGYVVLVVNPSGATGFGQEFSALHVNNWGITVADEIIESTKQFLLEHPFVDPKAVGSIGASYGGFMTMLLATRTDIFAASISHAGISSISSYWGEGFWGYLYSATATANSYPWNNKEIYVEQSPLFHADKVSTPLLLLHGDQDTNVPRGESIQMYTALKLLGKTVEYIEVQGQNHTILDYKKRIQWQKTIMAWFDNWLKDQPQWWEELYPERNL
jgi:dipeptidyl aminopeptidase/acylaminoacyl peptidase